MTADAFIQFRVTPAVKTLLRGLADREQLTESALVRQLVETMLRMQLQAGVPKLAEMERVSRDSRLYVRLNVDDRKLLMERSLARGLASATYVALLVRAHLRSVAPLPKEELLALKRSIAELAAVGRHLNQIARVLNQGGRSAGPGRQEVQAMLKVAEGLRDHFKALLTANARAWETGDAETAH
jgi:hypothetical protein